MLPKNIITNKKEERESCAAHAHMHAMTEHFALETIAGRHNCFLHMTLQQTVPCLQKIVVRPELAEGV